MPKGSKKSVPPFLTQARAFYADAFAHHRKSELADAMSEWTELDEAEQSFAIAHLAYLGIEAQAQTQQLLVQVRDLLDELAEAFTVAVEASFAEPPPDEDGDDGGADEPVLMDSEPLDLAQLGLPDVIDAEPAGGSP
jgi:hypothetical protein